jgi:GTP-binding protein YchF
MKLGIIGLAQSGKTTIFNALTRRSGESAPGGGKVAPVQGVVAVPDLRVDWLSELYQPKKTTYAQVTYIDLQGMPGGVESKPEHMAQLITHMRPVDAMLMVIRNFPHPGLGKPDVARDFQELQDEFLLTDLATIEKRLERISQEQRKGKPFPAAEKDLLDACAALLNSDQPLRANAELAAAPELRGFTFLSAKPLLVIVNNADEDQVLPEVSFGDIEAMVVRGKLEMEMAQLPEDEAMAFREDFGITESAVDRVIQRSFALLQVASFLTVGDDEVKAWTIRRHLPAVEAAGAIHSDLQKGFIRAEVVAYEDLRRAGDYAAARKLGVVRLEGRTYPVEDGDVIHFRFNI